MLMVFVCVDYIANGVLFVWNILLMVLCLCGLDC